MIAEKPKKMKKTVILTIFMALIAIICPLNTNAATDSADVKKTKALFEKFDDKIKELLVYIENLNDNNAEETHKVFLDAYDIGLQIQEMQDKMSKSDIKQVDMWLKAKIKQDPGFQERREIFDSLLQYLRDNM